MNKPSRHRRLSRLVVEHLEARSSPTTLGLAGNAMGLAAVGAAAYSPHYLVAPARPATPDHGWGY
jgi:hypothetical protein